VSVLNYFIGCLKGGKTLDTFDSNPNILTNVENTSRYAERVEKIVKVVNNQENEYDIEKAYQRICNALSNE
jgi:hypothetical protein